MLRMVGSMKSTRWSNGAYKVSRELQEDWESGCSNTVHRFNSDKYLRNPIIYNGVTQKTSRTGKKSKPFVHYFNTTGIMQHNDIGPQWHPTDVGAIKVASHLQRTSIRVVFAPF